MKNLRRNFERYCYVNRNKGIPNLMLYIVLGNAVVYLISAFTGNYVLYNLLCFNRAAILHGQVWRLITYPLTTLSSNILFMLITLLCYYSLGTAMERQWGTLKFNLFYLSGVVLMDVYGMLFNCQADVYYLNMSLFLGFYCSSSSPSVPGFLPCLIWRSSLLACSRRPLPPITSFRWWPWGTIFCSSERMCSMWCPFPGRTSCAKHSIKHPSSSRKSSIFT